MKGSVTRSFGFAAEEDCHMKLCNNIIFKIDKSNRRYDLKLSPLDHILAASVHRHDWHKIPVHITDKFGCFGSFYRSHFSSSTFPAS